MVSVLAVVVDCVDARMQAAWWAQLLDYRLSERNPGEFEVSDARRSGTPLYFMNVPESKSAKNRLHIDVTTDGPLEDEIVKMTGMGAVLVEMRQDPSSFDHPDTWAVMRDPEGNEFCVLNAESVTGLT